MRRCGREVAWRNRSAFPRCFHASTRRPLLCDLCAPVVNTLPAYRLQAAYSVLPSAVEEATPPPASR